MKIILSLLVNASFILNINRAKDSVWYRELNEQIKALGKKLSSLS